MRLIALLALIAITACGSPDDAEQIIDASARDTGLIDGGRALDASLDGLPVLDAEMSEGADAEPVDAAPPCEIGESRCVDGDTFERCLRDRTWGQRDCDEGYGCNPAVGECRILVCPPDQLICDADDERRFTRCLPDGSAWVSGVCQDDAVCGDRGCLECTPGTTRCLGDEMVQACEDDAISWTRPEPCPNATLCAGDRCRREACISRVLLLVDRSGSMGDDWDAVRQSIGSVVSLHDDVFFGLMPFPRNNGCGVGQPVVPISNSGRDVLDHWMLNNPPEGGTPLLAAMTWLAGNRDTAWGDVPEGHLIVLSDGADSCGGENTVELLGDATARLAGQGVHTHVIGYAFGGDTTELDIIAANGDTARDAHVPAGDEAVLADVIGRLVDDIKLCPDP